MDHAITHIIDMEGFIVESRFVVKELSIINCKSRRIYHTSFRLAQKFSDLSNRDRDTCNMLYHHVHGMKFEDDYRYDRYDQNSIQEVIEKYLRMEHLKGTHAVFGFNGGYAEKNILCEMGISCIDLNNFGCPSLSALATDARCKLITDPNCHKHKVRYTEFKGEVLHCTAVEVQLYNNWLDCYKLRD